MNLYLLTYVDSLAGESIQLVVAGDLPQDAEDAADEHIEVKAKMSHLKLLGKAIQGVHGVLSEKVTPLGG